MRSRAETLTTLVVFAIVMAGVGWFAHATAPAIGDWLATRIGEAGVWAVLIVVWLAAGIYAWRGHRPKAGSGRPFGR